MSFKEALNDAIRSGVTRGEEPFRTQTASMGVSAVNLDRALQVMANLDDDERIRQMRSGS